MGVTQGMVSKWESREYNFTIRSLNEICEKVDLELSVYLEKPCLGKDYRIVRWDKEKTPGSRWNSGWNKVISKEEAIA